MRRILLPFSTYSHSKLSYLRSSTADDANVLNSSKMEHSENDVTESDFRFTATRWRPSSSVEVQQRVSLVNRFQSVYLC